MTGLYQEYLDNLNAACALAKPMARTDLTAEEMIAAIRSCSRQIHELHQKNDRILQQLLFSKTPEALTAGEAESLFELAGALFSFNRSPDTGVAFRIHKLLYEYARFRQDPDMTVRELYFQGITLLYLNVREPSLGVNLFLDEIGGYFRAGADYLDRYEELESHETRSYIVRCLGNLKYGLASFQGGNDGTREFSISDGWDDYMACFDRAMAVIESPRYRRMNPEIPWDSFAYTMHFDRTQFLSGLRERDDPVIARAVLESAEYVYRHQEQLAKVKGRGIGRRTRYVYAAARYHAGVSDIQELCRVLFEIYANAGADDFSGDNIWVILYVPEYLTHYTSLLPEEEARGAVRRLGEIFDKQKDFLFRLPQNEYALQVSKTLHNITKYDVSLQDPRSSLRLLDYILACHPPTFVHSKVVALLSRRFCERMAAAAPELLEGAFGLRDPAGDPGRLAELLEKTYRSGLYHDLGKCMLLSYVGMYSRRLLDEEFACIKLHPLFGCQLLESLDMKEISSAALFHHRSYDGKGGYPSGGWECPAAIRRIVDIITVVDALDAGTDNVGRSYAAAKTYEQLVEELRAGAGVRYAPEVVALLDDPDFCRETGRFLADSRGQAYIDAYFRMK